MDVTPARLFLLSRRGDQAEARLPCRLRKDLAVNQPEGIALFIPGVVWYPGQDRPARIHLLIDIAPHRLGLGDMSIGIDNTYHFLLLVYFNLSRKPLFLISFRTLPSKSRRPSGVCPLALAFVD